MSTTDWLLLAAGVALGLVWAKRKQLLAIGAAGAAGVGGIAGAGAPMTLSAGDLLNPGSVRSKSPMDQAPAGAIVMGQLNAAVGPDPYAGIFNTLTIPNTIDGHNE